MHLWLELPLCNPRERVEVVASLTGVSMQPGPDETVYTAAGKPEPGVAERRAAGVAAALPESQGGPWVLEGRFRGALGVPEEPSRPAGPGVGN